jgi:hypothetical protein
MDAMELPSVNDEPISSDVSRVRGADNFASGFFGSIGTCYARHRIERQPTPILGGLGISAAAAFLLTLMSRLSYRRQVARASAAQARARQDLEKRRTAAHSVVTDAVPTRPATMVGGATAAPPRRTTMAGPERDTFGVPARPERRSGGVATVTATSLGASTTLSSLDMPPHATNVEPGIRPRFNPNQVPPSADQLGLQTAVVASSSSAPPDPQAAAAPSPVFGWDVDWNDDEFEKMLRKVTTSSMPAVGSLQHPQQAGAGGLADALGLDGAFDAVDADDPFGANPTDAARRPLGPATAEPHAGGGDVAAMLEKIVMPDVVYADRDPRFGLRVSAPDANLPSTARVDVRLVTSEGVPHQIWPAPRPLASLAGSESLATARTAAISIPWRDIATEVGRLVERGNAKGVSLRVSVAVANEEVFAAAPILDALTLDFVADGEPIPPTIVRITAPSGRVLRAVVGTEQPGRLSLRGIDAGPYELSFEEGSLFAHQNGATAPRLSARTDAIYGLTHSRGDAQVVRRRILVVTPRVAYVSPTGTGIGDGTAERPFDRVSSALSALALQPTGEGPRRPIEIRLTPGTRDLRERLDLARAPDGTVPWEAWWSERPVPTSTAWTVDVDEQELRRDARRFAAGAFRLDIAVDELDAVRIVNAEYAEARERAARDPDRLFQLDAELSRIPLVELGAPTDDIRQPFRVVVSGCADVILEGLHFVGAMGQSGLSLVDCRAVRVHRCVFEHFESGPVARSGAWAVGRGVQVERSGEPERPVEFVLCEFGWNRSTRKSMPVKGAGIAVYEASLRLTRCFLHHNVASAQPPDIYASGHSRVSGDATNHREANRVEIPAKT